MAKKIVSANVIVNPFKIGNKHDFVFNQLLNGVTFEQLRENIMAKYNDTSTSSRANVRMFIQNIRNKSIPVSYDHRTGLYRIGSNEPEPVKTKKSRSAKKPVTAEPVNDPNPNVTVTAEPEKTEPVNVVVSSEPDPIPNVTEPETK